MHMVLRCDCGFKVAGDTEAELVTAAQAHASEVHDVHVAEDVVLRLVRSRHGRDGSTDSP